MVLSVIEDADQSVVIGFLRNSSPIVIENNLERAVVLTAEAGKTMDYQISHTSLKREELLSFGPEFVDRQIGHVSWPEDLQLPWSTDRPTDHLFVNVSSWEIWQESSLQSRVFVRAINAATSKSSEYVCVI